MTGLMAGKRGLIMGLANDRSLAWGIAKALGGAITFSHTFGESPMAGDVPKDAHGRIMHIAMQAVGFGHVGRPLRGTLDGQLRA